MKKVNKIPVEDKPVELKCDYINILKDIERIKKETLNPPTKRYIVHVENDLGGKIVSVKNIRAQTKYEAIEKVKNNLVFTAFTTGNY